MRSAPARSAPVKSTTVVEPSWAVSRVPTTVRAAWMSVGGRLGADDLFGDTEGGIWR